ncbi:hypothetical protein ILUMI_19524 [Ignelater luminosus]|uniref:Uncharacterized protein n=1 Tax=Ignelater luminosus TaxID=2038154 RepID=A0A8K0G5E4_IGNLU|nr:hypothetical protein ILUMI_19524 [Ignelater luminosus]
MSKTAYKVELENFQVKDKVMRGKNKLRGHRKRKESHKEGQNWIPKVRPETTNKPEEQAKKTESDSNPG